MAKKEHTIVHASTPAGSPKPAKPVGNAAGIRAGALILWALAIGFEVMALLVVLGKFAFTFAPSLYQMVGFMVLDLICLVIGSQLWKKANHIKPASEKNPLQFWLWNNMGLLVSVIAFVPLLVIILTKKDLDKNTKLIGAIAAVVCLAIGGLTSYDYNPVSLEQQQAAIQEFGDQEVYWTKYGKVYHSHEDCGSLNRTDELTVGNVEQAIAASKTRLCKNCAKTDGITDVKTEE